MASHLNTRAHLNGHLTYDGQSSGLNRVPSSWSWSFEKCMCVLCKMSVLTFGDPVCFKNKFLLLCVITFTVQLDNS